MTTLTLLLFLLPLAFSPGPGNLFFAAHGARFGWRKSLPALAGYHAATITAALAVGGGLLVVAGPDTARLLLWAGTGYMIWLALRLWRASSLPRQTDADHASIWDGVALLALNPKAWAIMAALFVQFPSADWQTMTWVAAVFTINNAVAFLVWTVLGQSLLARIQNPAHLRQINRAFAVLLAAVAIWVAVC